MPTVASQGAALDAALASVDPQFRTRIAKQYLNLKSGYVQGHHDRCGVQAGHLCESLFRFVQHRLTGTFIPFGTQIPNFIDECRKLEQLPKTAGPDGIRVVMPRALQFLYTLRTKRGFGHPSGDGALDANAIDAATCVRVADWCLSELIREVNALPIEEAQKILDAISARQLPAVWSVRGRYRVLDKSLDHVDQILLLLYFQSDGSATDHQLFDWIGHGHKTRFTRGILRPLHQERFIEYDQKTGTVVLSPTGTSSVEERLLKKVTAPR